jgi:hypothetical protein
MTAADIADELRALKFNDGKQFNAVKLDEQVRDFWSPRSVRGTPHAEPEPEGPPFGRPV